MPHGPFAVQSGFLLTSAPTVLYQKAHWYACHTRARHEKKAAASLEQRGVESFLPLLARDSVWSDRVKRVAVPLFSGYVFARFTLDELTRVLCSTGVAGVVKLRGYPSPIPCAQIENVRHACAAAADEVEPSPEAFPSGAWVRVTSGPLAGLVGIVTETRGSRCVRVGISAIGRWLDVVVGTAVLEPTCAPA